MSVSEQRKEHLRSLGKKFYRKPTLEQQLADNLRELEMNPEAEVLPITEGYLAYKKGGTALADYLAEKSKNQT